MGVEGASTARESVNRTRSAGGRLLVGRGEERRSAPSPLLAAKTFSRDFGEAFSASAGPQPAETASDYGVVSE